MSIYLVAWLAVSWDCPWGLGRLPDPVKPVACTEHRQIRTEAFDPARRRQAQQLLEDLGPGATATLLEIHGTQARAVSAVWRPTLRIGN